jgi:hypothetical protein
MVGPLEQAILALMIFVIMLGMGASLTPRDFVLALKRPYGLIIGVVSQYGFMPFIAFLLAISLPVPDPIKIGILIMGCMPGGTTSNIFTYFSKGNLALSVLMTVNSTVFGVLLIPLVLVLYAGALDLQIPRENIIATLVLLLVPVAIGMGLRKLNANTGAVTEFLGSLLGVGFFHHGGVLLGHLVHLVDGGVDLGKAGRLLAAGGRHGANMLGDFLDAGDDAGDGLAGLADQRHPGTDFLAGGCDQFLDLLGGVGRAARQLADLLGDDGKALAGFARTRSLDTGIERQKVGLEGDLVDDADDPVDLARRLLDAAHGIDGTGDDLARGAGVIGGVAGELVGVRRAARGGAHRWPRSRRRQQRSPQARRPAARCGGRGHGEITVAHGAQSSTQAG